MKKREKFADVQGTLKPFEYSENTNREEYTLKCAVKEEEK